ncbi:TolC family protein [Undibacterium sp. Xuan67W]|uniref:TolC family protein n=1 Tax=Undibacterium sp. Xuan67W TaxID=3413057 RepID=UPI003BF2158F
MNVSHYVSISVLVFLSFNQKSVFASESALSILPSETVVRKVFEGIPALRMSSLGVDLASSNKQRLDAGHYEWTLRTGLNHRTDQLGDRFQEQELLIERPVRWFGKADKDRAIGEKGIDVAKASYADVWHETSRVLMKDWFDSIREIVSVKRLQEQLEVTSTLRAVAEKRVKAGDAAKLELLLADTEYQRVLAMLQQALQREESALQVLRTNYPGLPMPECNDLPEPKILTEPVETWMSKIMGDNHELELAQAESDYIGLQAARISRDKIPDPTVGFRISRERNGQERIFGVSISIPFSGEGRNSESASAFLRARMADEKIKQTEMKVNLAAKKAITDSQLSYTSWKTFDIVRLQSQQQAALVLTAYKLGEASLTDALNTRRIALDATQMAQSAQIDALMAFARLHLDAHLIWAFD